MDCEENLWHLHTLRKGKMISSYVIVAKVAKRVTCCPFETIQELQRRWTGCAEGDGALFRSEDGKQSLSYSELRLIVNDLLRSVEAPKWVTPYLLKHLGISLLFKEGITQQEIRLHTGHSSRSEVALNTYNLHRNTIKTQTVIFNAVRKKKKARAKKKQSKEEKDQKDEKGRGDK